MLEESNVILSNLVMILLSNTSRMESISHFSSGLEDLRTYELHKTFERVSIRYLKDDKSLKTVSKLKSELDLEFEGIGVCCYVVD